MGTEQNKLIVALDVQTAREALELVGALRGGVGMFKVGMQLFTAAGPDLVREIVRSGERVFLDLKYHDIPNTVAAAAVEATRLGVSMFNVHATGGAEMMRSTADAVLKCVDSEGLAKPIMLGVTILTSANAATLKEVGFQAEPSELVPRLAQLSDLSGMDGVVASAREVEIVRTAVTRTDFVVVTPGIRPAGSDPFDQKRVTSPRQALEAGADYIVVGRPILEAPDPAQAAQEILAEMATSDAKGVGI
jgi:orotidine-5'-phosphate decarboxylase